MTAFRPDRYAVLGNPVAHSQSPFIHTEFARLTGQIIDYRRVLSPMDAFEAVVRAFEAGGARGCNITMPFKLQVAALARTVSPAAELAGAANVLRFAPEGWQADNTDGTGLVRDIERNAQLPLLGLRVLLIGAGGAAAGALGPLMRARPAVVQVANRTLAKAQALVDRHAGLARQLGVQVQAGSLGEAEAGYDVVINASASSLQGAQVPVDPRVLRAGTLAVDMMYGDAALPYLQWAREHGATPRDGLGMLVEQAADAFMLFRGVMPPTAPVLHMLRQRLAMGSQQQQQQQ